MLLTSVHLLNALSPLSINGNAVGLLNPLYHISQAYILHKHSVHTQYIYLTLQVGCFWFPSNMSTFVRLVCQYMCRDLPSSKSSFRVGITQSKVYNWLKLCPSMLAKVLGLVDDTNLLLINEAGRCSKAGRLFIASELFIVLGHWVSGDCSLTLSPHQGVGIGSTRSTSLHSSVDLRSARHWSSRVPCCHTRTDVRHKALTG